MNIAAMIFMLVVGSIAQHMVPGVKFLGDAKIPFLLSIVVYYALSRELKTALPAAIIAGLFQDALSEIPLGYSSFCFLVAALAAYRFKEIVFEESIITTAIFGAFLSGSTTLVLHLLLWRVGLVKCPFWWAALKVGGSILLGAVAAPPVFRTALWFDRLMGNVKRKKDLLDDQIRFI